MKTCSSVITYYYFVDFSPIASWIRDDDLVFIYTPGIISGTFWFCTSVWSMNHIPCIFLIRVRKPPGRLDFGILTSKPEDVSNIFALPNKT